MYSINLVYGYFSDYRDTILGPIDESSVIVHEKVTLPGTESKFLMHCPSPVTSLVQEEDDDATPETAEV